MSLSIKHCLFALAGAVAALLLVGACIVETTPTAVPTRIPATPTLPIPTETSPPLISSPTPEYDRDEWGGWIDADGDCQNTRAEVLIEESLVEVVLDGCRVVEGEWLDMWDGKTYYSAGDVDIDHHVPLAHAHQTGGALWSEERKVEFANDPENLNAMSSSLNRSKGSRGPDEWKPPEETSYCEYARQWEAVKEKYQLAIDGDERQALDEMLESCDLSLPTPPPSRYLPTQPSPTATSPPVSIEGVYESCDEAIEAGEQRIRGESGPGLGFPQAMVPTARDGDKDGVVCER